MNHVLRKLFNRVRLMVSRGVVTRTNAGAMCQELQCDLLADETADEIEHFEPYGFTSRPNTGAEAIVVSVGADRSHPVAIVVGDRRYRVTGLEPGEACVYNDAGARIFLRDDGSIALVPAAGQNVELATEPGSDFVALSTPLDTWIAAVDNTIRNWVVAPNDGGAALKTFYLGLVATPPSSMAADRVRAT